MNISENSRPKLRAGCRFSENPAQKEVLLIPEGLIKLAGPGRQVLELCDGERTFAQILAALGSTYTTAAHEQIERDTALYLERLHERGVVEY